MPSTRRALHFVIKVTRLNENLKFFRDVLGMTVLRHELFEGGCEAACNGPYDNKWSKTMIGYGPEDNHFVLELTYNYAIGSYKLGNDFNFIKMSVLPNTMKRISESNWNSLKVSSSEELELISPDGYRFIVNKINDDTSQSQDIVEVCLACKSIDKTVDYWTKVLNCQLKQKNEQECSVRYDKNQAALTFKQINEDINHGSAYGRIAFSCPADELKPLEKRVTEGQNKILTPYISLDTPGKATVQVVILADPDGHEICFVGDEGFRELSKVDAGAEAAIEQSISEDKSEEWFVKKNKTKQEA